MSASPSAGSCSGGGRRRVAAPGEQGEHGREEQEAAHGRIESQSRCALQRSRCVPASRRRPARTPPGWWRAPMSEVGPGVSAWATDARWAGLAVPRRIALTPGANAANRAASTSQCRPSESSPSAPKRSHASATSGASGRVSNRHGALPRGRLASTPRPRRSASGTAPESTPWSTRLTEHWTTPKAPERTAQSSASFSPEYAATRTLPARTVRCRASTTSPRSRTSRGQECRCTRSTTSVRSRASAPSTPASTAAPVQSGTPGTP